MKLSAQGRLQAAEPETQDWARPDTLLGMLQRGRGLGLQKALQEGASDVVLTCLGQGLRWDSCEERGWYFARLVTGLGIEPARLPWEPTDPELVHSMVFETVVQLAAMGSTEAVGMIQGHLRQVPVASVGDVVERVWEGGGALAREGLADIALGRLDDAALAQAVWVWEDGPWHAWRHVPRVAVALEAMSPVKRVPPPSFSRDSNAELLALGRRLTRARQELPTPTACRGDSAWRRRAAFMELADRGELALLELAEEPSLRNQFDIVPSLVRALVHLGPAAVPRARAWLESDDAWLPRVALDILVAHGDAADSAAIAQGFDAAVDGGQWTYSETLADGLARLRVASATSSLLGAFERTEHSHARGACLGALLALEPTGVCRLVAEAADDCESEVRKLASTRPEKTTFTRET